jgi:hypothetical protein
MALKHKILEFTRLSTNIVLYPISPLFWRSRDPLFWQAMCTPRVVVLHLRSERSLRVNHAMFIFRRCRNFPKICKPSQNSRRQKTDMEQGQYWAPKQIRPHRIKFNHPGKMTLEICVTLCIFLNELPLTLSSRTRCMSRPIGRTPLP